MQSPLFQELFEDLRRFFSKNGISFYYDKKNKTLDILELFNFLITHGNNEIISSYLEEIDDDSEEHIYNLIKGQISLHDFFPPEIYRLICHLPTWDFTLVSLKRKSYSSQENIHHFFDCLFPQLVKLYEKYFPFYTIPAQGYDIIIELLHSCIIFLDDVPFKSQIVTPQLLIQPTAAFEIFKEILKKETKIIISGPSGCGKTYFIKSFIKEYFNKTDYCIITFQNALDYTLDHIEFKDAQFREGNEIYKILEHKSKHSFLIIDGMNLPHKELKSALTKLSKLDLTIIVISCDIKDSDSFYKMNFQLTDEELCSIFSHIIPDTAILEKHRSDLFTWTYRNAALVSMLAYAEKKSPSIINEIINLPDDIAFIPTDNMKKYKHPYNPGNSNDKKSHFGEANLIKHAKKIYNIQFIKKDYSQYRLHLKVLSCFFNTVLPKHFLNQIIPDCNSWQLNKLAKLGFLEILPGKCVQMSPLIAEAIYEHERPDYSNLSEIIQNMCSFLDHYDTYQKGSLGNIFISFVKRIDASVKLSNNPGQKAASKDQEQWWSFIYRCIEYYQNIGDTRSAELLIAMLKYPDNLIYQRSYIDKSLFAFINQLKPASMSIMPHPAYSKLMENLETDPSSVNLVTLNYLLTVLLDNTIVYLWETENEFEHVKGLNFYHTIFTTLTINYMPFAKYVFYQNAYLFLSKPPEDLSESFIKEYWETVDSYAYSNMRIQGYTHLLLVLYKKMQFKNNYSKNDLEFILYVKQKNLIVPEITTKTDSIMNLIPSYASDIYKSLKREVLDSAMLPGSTGNICFCAYSLYALMFRGFRKNKIQNLTTILYRDVKTMIGKCIHYTKEEKEYYLEEISNYLKFLQV